MLLTNRFLLQKTGEAFECPDPDRSYSPMNSSVGLLSRAGEKGIGAAVLHYNRSTRVLFETTIETDLPYNALASDITGLICGNGVLSLHFYEKNAFSVLMPKEVHDMCQYWFDGKTDGISYFYGFSKNGDDRDPDEFVPFCIAILEQKGYISQIDGTLAGVPKDGELVFHAVLRFLDPDRQEMRACLRRAPRTAEDAAARTAEWLADAARDLSLRIPDTVSPNAIRSSLIGILMNLTAAEGSLSRHLSAFPSRGEYPTHFLWDTCFQNLLYEQLNADIAKDLLLQNADLQREDGKLGQFLCSTWVRPHDTQPALLGWAALRLIKKTGDQAFAEKILPAIEKNNQWWTAQRITDIGLISTRGGLETGQDNSPRFDRGPTIAADMNAYLLDQFHAAAQIAAFIGDKDKADAWKKKAEAFAKLIRDYLYDAEEGLFFDILPSSLEPVRVVSPSALLPIWAGGVLTDGEAKAAIKKQLLAPEIMFGAVPFPSVAYNDPTYRSNDWWRGPTWMPMAWLMLECLMRYGFYKEARIAAQRLCDTVEKDGVMHELFDSRTGEGMGAAQQGWTCAVYAALLRLLSSDGAEYPVL